MALVVAVINDILIFIHASDFHKYWDLPATLASVVLYILRRKLKCQDQGKTIFLEFDLWILSHE